MCSRGKHKGTKFGPESEVGVGVSWKIGKNYVEKVGRGTLEKLLPAFVYFYLLGVKEIFQLSLFILQSHHSTN